MYFKALEIRKNMKLRLFFERLRCDRIYAAEFIKDPNSMLKRESVDINNQNFISILLAILDSDRERALNLKNYSNNTN